MTKERFYLAVGVIVLLAAAILGGIRFFSDKEGVWVCEDGQWAKHGNPSVAVPKEKCPGAVEQVVSTQTETSTTVVIDKLIKPEIEVDSPLLNAEVASPLIVKGKARGNWYFEASFPIKITDDKGNVLAIVPAQAKSDWMTEEFVPFEAKLEFDSSLAKNGKIILSKDNPSGDSALDKSYELPVIFSGNTSTTSQQMIVKIFLGSEKLNPASEDCSKVFPVERVVKKTESVGRVALEQLLIGPSQAELADGYFTSLSSGVKIKSLIIKDGVAKADFDKTMDESVGGSCRVSAIRAQVIQTLRQFSSVKDVVISVEGNVDEALQP